MLAGRGASLVMGDYVILAEIGAGGMGQVYKAKHRRMERIVALKVMSSAAMKDEAAVKRFQREVRAAAKLEHSNIVTAYDSGEAGNVKYLVMQFVDGGDLSSLVKSQGPLPIEKAVDYVLQAARGLSFAHTEGVIHRDIKPANLLVDKKNVVKILDMGLARIESSDDGLTATEQVMGTVDYMSPEQAANTKGADGRADIYSLGCTLWYLLIGRKTYEGDTMIARLMAHRDAPLPSLVKTRDDAPWALEQVLHKMIAKRPQDRYQSMDDVIGALEPLGSGGTSTKGPMGSSIGGGSQPNAELAAFLQSVGPKPSASGTNLARQKRRWSRQARRPRRLK
ncbi:MAG: serine/threonine-protein kinase [Pirellulales bacterium]